MKRRYRQLWLGTVIGLLACAPLAHGLTISGGLVINTGDQDAAYNNITGGGAGDNATVIRSWLEGEILSYFNHNGVTLPQPTDNYTKWDSGTGIPSSVSLLAGDYLVLHYGVGQNGVAGSGGGLVALYFGANQLFTVPTTGFLGPNGLGGISSVALLDHVPGGEPGPGVPDGATTVSLLGIALAGIGVMRRKLAF